MVVCRECGRYFTLNFYLQRHIFRVHGAVRRQQQNRDIRVLNPRSSCLICGDRVNPSDLANHVRAQHLVDSEFREVESAFRRRVITYRLTLENVNSAAELVTYVGEIGFLLLCELVISANLTFALVALSVATNGEDQAELNIGQMQRENFVQRSTNFELNLAEGTDGILRAINLALNQLQDREESLEKASSGWIITCLLALNVEIIHQPAIRHNVRV